MRNFRIFLCLGIICCSFLLPLNAQEEKQLIILHTNDLHSRLNGFAPEAEYSPFTPSDDSTRGGFARIATIIRKEKELHGRSVIVADAGDFLMGTLFQNLEESDGFQLRLMKEMGYDLVTLGNHEFDFGPSSLAKMISKAVQSGPIPAILASSMIFSQKDSISLAIKKLFDQEVLKGCHVVEVNGIHVGFFSLLGNNAVSVAPTARPLTFRDPVKTAEKFVKYLREAQKADLVICLSHSGLTPLNDGTWGGEDVELAKKVPGIDLIISGHTHTLLEKPIIINQTPIVQTGCFGMNVGRLELTVKNRRITDLRYRLIRVDDNIPGDSAIQAKINVQEKRIEEKYLKPLRLSYSSVIAHTAFPLYCNQEVHPETSNLGMLIADALYAYINGHDPQGADITMFSAGMVRDNIEPGMKGLQTVPDIYNTVCLGRGRDGSPGYPIARIYVTGRELKGILEILYLAPSASSDYYIYFGGLRAKVDPQKGLLKKIVEIEVGNEIKGYRKVDDSRKNKQLYSLTANSYVLGFVGILRKMSKGLVRVTLKNEKGVPMRSFEEALVDTDPVTPGLQEMKEWQAMMWFLSRQPDTNGDGIPDIPDTYRTGTPRLSVVKP